MLDRLYQEGLLARETERAGKRPERMRYRITDQGRARFDALLRAQFASLDVIKPAGNVALLFMQRVPPGEAAELFGQRKQELAARRARIQAELDELPAKNPALPIFERNLALIDADIGWLEKQIARLLGEARL